METLLNRQKEAMKELDECCTPGSRDTDEEREDFDAEDEIFFDFDTEDDEKNEEENDEEMKVGKLVKSKELKRKAAEKEVKDYDYGDEELPAKKSRENAIIDCNTTKEQGDTELQQQLYQSAGNTAQYSFAFETALVPVNDWQVRPSQIKDEEKLLWVIDNYDLYGHCIDDAFNLLKRGVNPNIGWHSGLKDKWIWEYVSVDGDTPLHLSCSVAMVRLLLGHHHIDVNVINSEGETPLHMAVKCENVKKVENLLDHPLIDVNAGTWDTPLYCAVVQHTSVLVKTLLKHHRTEVNVLDSDGKTPLDMALQHGIWSCFDDDDDDDLTGEWSRFDILQVLLKAGSKCDDLQTFSLQLSYKKDILSHRRAAVKIAELFHDFGGLKTKDSGGNFLFDLFCKNENDTVSEEAKYIKDLCERPQSLQSCCRLLLRRFIVQTGREQSMTTTESLKTLTRLPLPRKLCLYLQHE